MCARAHDMQAAARIYGRIVVMTHEVFWQDCSEKSNQKSKHSDTLGPTRTPYAVPASFFCTHGMPPDLRSRYEWVDVLRG